MAVGLVHPLHYHRPWNWISGKLVAQHLFKHPRTIQLFESDGFVCFVYFIQSLQIQPLYIYLLVNKTRESVLSEGHTMQKCCSWVFCSLRLSRLSDIIGLLLHYYKLFLVVVWHQRCSLQEKYLVPCVCAQFKHFKLHYCMHSRLYSVWHVVESSMYVK